MSILNRAGIGCMLLGMFGWIINTNAKTPPDNDIWTILLTLIILGLFVFIFGPKDE